jgi:acetyltransferase-like isoleucine patch superfamily enzyme
MGCRVVVQRHAMVSVRSGALLEIGDRTRIGSDAVIASGQSVIIGKSVLIAARCYIGDYGHAFLESSRPVMEQGAEDGRPVTIGDGSWLGINVCILPGATLGRNCVVAANSVVRDSFPDASVIAGVPAKLVRRLPGFELA